MKHAAYHQAAHPEPHVVLGRLLRPYSIGHRELLYAAESSFVIEPADGESAPPITWDDLALSVLICSQTYEEGQELLWRIRSDPKFALRHCRAMEKWGRKLKLPNIDAAAAAFARYLTEGSREINIRYELPDSDVRNEAPEHQLVKCHFLFHSCLTETQIMNRPWGLARAEWMTHMALQGLVTIESEEGENAERKELEADAECVTEDLLAGATDVREIGRRIRDARQKRRASCQPKPDEGGDACAR